MKYLVGAMIGFGLLGGCSNAPAPEGYRISVDEAYQRLVNNELTELRDAYQCGILVHLRPEGVPGRSVTWRVSSGGREMLRFTANLIPVEGGGVKTQIAISHDDDGKEAYSGSRTYRRPAFNQPLRPAVEEQIAAIMEGRPLDPNRMPRGEDSVCDVQRAGLESGRGFGVNDKPGLTSRQSAGDRAASGWGAGSGAGWGR